VLKVKQEMKNTMAVLSNIANTLDKPRRKYQFYYTSLEKDLQGLVDKKLDETDLHIGFGQRFNDTLFEGDSEPKVVVQEYLEPEDEELDQTGE
jgi:hypothetical protein